MNTWEKKEGKVTGGFKLRNGPLSVTSCRDA